MKKINDLYEPAMIGQPVALNSHGKMPYFEGVNSRQWLLTVGLAIATIPLHAEPFDGVRALIARRVPWLGPHIRFAQIPPDNGMDVAVLQTEDGMLWVKASSASAAAVGVNRYLEDYCHRSMSHRGDNLGPVADLPAIGRQVRILAEARYRYALNYCTWNYTMSFYQWDDWSRELDWMALNGVNLMLVAGGEEAVWQQVLRRLGCSQSDISAYLAGPAFTAWWLMGNLQGWGGPMPQTQIDGRESLTRRMLERMKDLGITPVMPGFYGMIPTSLTGRLNAHVSPQGLWAGGFQRPAMLDPGDPAFDRVAGIFYEETKKAYGADLRFFSGDPFHEGGNSNGIDVPKAGARIQQAMQRSFPGAVWVLQGWQANPRKEMLAGLGKRYVLIQELAGERTNNWEARGAYEHTPFIWCTVTNFGEKPGVGGKLQHFADETYRAFHGPYAAYMRGVGIMPEGIDNNPVVYALALELGWRQDSLDVSRWIRKYVSARYGRADPDMLEAWHLLLHTVYSSVPGKGGEPSENILCARPGLEVHSVSTWGGIAKTYDTREFANAVALFERAAVAGETYRLDRIDLERQVLANRADTVYSRVVQAYSQKDATSFDAAAADFLRLADQEDSLLNTDSCFRLSTYQRQALAAGHTPEEKHLNLRNALTLVTYWGAADSAKEELRDYAYKEWGGMMGSFYKARWEKYFAYLRAKLQGKPATPPDFYEEDRAWVETQLQLEDQHGEGGLLQ